MSFLLRGRLRKRRHSGFEGLEARIRNGRKNPGLDKLVDVAQAEIQRTRVAIDAAGKEALSRVLAVEVSNIPTQNCHSSRCF